VAYTVRRELGGRLQDDLAPVSEKQDALVLLDRALDDFARDDGLAAAGRGDKDRAPMRC
jgi:hypothetical protein